MLCPELISNRAAAPVKLYRFERLHREGRRLISGWFERAWQARECPPEDSFEPFNFGWFAFNGWAACVTELDQDRAYLNALMRCSQVTQQFEDALNSCKSGLVQHASSFASLWPIFDVRALRQRGIRPWDAQHLGRAERAGLVQDYLSRGATSFQPQCWVRHQEAGEPIPLDWPHTLSALYRVRCNLFHGEKAAHSEMDQIVVVSALRTLLQFLHHTKYLEPS
jgi:hypothetical protein